MHYSVLDLFTIGVGPSSSHTVGPMRAAAWFIATASQLDGLAGVRCDLYGSLAATGKGHHTDKALILGFLGHQPETVPVDQIDDLIAQVTATKQLSPDLAFDPNEHLTFHRTTPLPRHPNGMHFQAFDAHGTILQEEIYYSLGGGFVCTEAEFDHPFQGGQTEIPYPYNSAKQLLEHTVSSGLSIAELTLANEACFRPEEETRRKFDLIWQAMQDCVERGCRHGGTLPGGLKVKRRAPAALKRLEARSLQPLDHDPLDTLDWVNLFALAVNEENASGGRVVTAPTNGAAGILPAVLHYATRFRKTPHPDGVHRFLLTAGAIGTLYKMNASISGADVGCQGEIGVACSMAAGALVEYLGGTPGQVENAAEIGMEHNLGLTCDPVGGLVQIPCIERNAMGSVKAINAARLAISGDGSHFISLDKVIRTMSETGKDMMTKYKETSRGGLAVNWTEC
ncbi:L-serine ammonia-lyase [Verrucomicrobiaceae bacterium 227]